MGRKIINVYSHELSEKEELMQDMFITLERITLSRLTSITYLCQELGAVEKAFETKYPISGGSHAMLPGFYAAYRRLVSLSEITDGEAIWIDGSPTESFYKGQRTELPENHDWIRRVAKLNQNEAYHLGSIVSDCIAYRKEEFERAVSGEELSLRLGWPESYIEWAIENYRRLKEWPRSQS